MYTVLEKRDLRLKGINQIFGEKDFANLFSSNVYSIGYNNITLVDAGDGCESNRLAPALKKANLNIQKIINVIITHSHDDHWGGLAELLHIIPLNIMVHKDDLPYYQEQLGHLEGISRSAILGLEDGDIIQAEGHNLKVLHTPGHDSGSICLYDEDCKVLFTGDTVFASGTTGSARSGNTNDLRKSLRRLTTIDVDVILPGHGDIAYTNGREVIRLALERMTWTNRITYNIPYQIKIDTYRKI
jgi:hydroxyacylglutathione hydrolase